jgi:tetratricopeptide (TPR) repeat protein
VPDNIQVREALIKIYLQKRDLAAARAAADELKSRQPNSAVGFYYVGLLAAQEKHLEEAQKNLERAHDLQPHLWDVLIALLKVQTARGSYDAAIGTVQAAIGQDSNNARLLELLGGLYLQEKDFVRAADAFTRESAKDAHSWQAHRNLATVKLAVNDPAGAASEYQAALQLGPVEPQLVLEAARFYEKQGRIDDAIQAYDRLYKGNPPTQQFAANNLAMLLVTYKTDRASLDRARDLTLPFANSDNGSLLDTAGWVHFKRGEYRDALPTLERALEKTPDSRVIRYHLGMDELQLGLRDRARDSLESAVAGSDNFEGVEEARTVLARLKARA